MRFCICCEIRPVEAEGKRLCAVCAPSESYGNPCRTRGGNCAGRYCDRCGRIVAKYDEYGETDWRVTNDGKLYCDLMCHDPSIGRCHQSCAGCDYCI